MTTRNAIIEKFNIFSGETGGIDSWLRPDSPKEIFDALGRLNEFPLSKARMNQLLTLAHEAPISEAMFQYYWHSVPKEHPYDVTKLPDYDDAHSKLNGISSIEHLYWGMYRFYVDALLFFGSIRTAYQKLRELDENSLSDYFSRYAFDVEELKERGPALKFDPISKDNRYLISEMACKSLEGADGRASELGKALSDIYADHEKRGGGPVTIRNLLNGEYAKNAYEDRQFQFEFAANDFLDEQIGDESELHIKMQRTIKIFESSRAVALENTKKYLSMVGDLDVYVATSMRTRQDFREMADFCETVFSDERLKHLNVRYFDPTMSSASHHEDKGLIECLMVKCAKVLIYHAGEQDSFGKDAEVAMALSLGKPVIIYCTESGRARFFREIHPLSRLVEFQSGVAVGAAVTSSKADISLLLYRILTNDMRYSLAQIEKGYLILKEETTNSTVRLQTNDELLRETFWNHYHNDR